MGHIVEARARESLQLQFDTYEFTGTYNKQGLDRECKLIPIGNKVEIIS